MLNSSLSSSLSLSMSCSYSTRICISSTISRFSLLLYVNKLRYKTLQNVIKSITYHRELLGIITLQTIITIFIFSVFAYTFIDYTFFNTDKSENMCTSLMQCFFVILSLGPRSSGSIGDILLRQSYKEENRNYFFLRYVFDILMFYIINIINLKILFGIVIETFAGKLKRAEKQKEHGRLWQEQYLLYL